MEELQSLSQQPLNGPHGERLVLRSGDARCPPPDKHRWFHNISSKNAAELLQGICDLDFLNMFDTWEWPAVVLMPEEYELHVGGMSVTELRQHLENYWGQGSIPGAKDYHNMIVWRAGGRKSNPALFGHWVNRECTQWLSYFIAKNHTLGAVHAWFTAFLGVTRKIMPNLEESFRNLALRRGAESVEFIHHIKIRMSFDVCIKDHDEIVDGLPSLPSNTVLTTNEKGMQVICSSTSDIFPRRIWDICANTVIPATWFCGPPCPLTGRRGVGALGVKPVSHAWVADEDRSLILTEANQQMWLIPLPKGVRLEDIRGEMIRLGVRYAWLDVLCLRQRVQPACATGLGIPVSIRREQRRLEEWKVDVPTIGAVYSNLDDYSLCDGGPIVIYMSGLGRPFRGDGWDSNRHWLRRAWTLQESPDLSKCLIAGLPGACGWGNRRASSWPWNCKV